MIDRQTIADTPCYEIIGRNLLCILMPSETTYTESRRSLAYLTNVYRLHVLVCSGVAWVKLKVGPDGGGSRNFVLGARGVSGSASL